MALQCKDLREDLVAFVDGELSPERADAVQAHVLGCAACAAEVEAHRAVWDVLGVIDDDAPLALPEAAWLDGIEAQVRRKGRPVVLWRWVAAAAVMALAVGLGIGSAVSPGGSGAVAVHPSGPAPNRPATPTTTVTPASPSPASPSPRTQPDSTRDPAPVEDPYAGLSAEEIAVVENLDVLVYLQTAEDAEVLENLDLLEDLDELELDGPG